MRFNFYIEREKTRRHRIIIHLTHALSALAVQNSRDSAGRIPHIAGLGSVKMVSTVKCHPVGKYARRQRQPLPTGHLLGVCEGTGCTRAPRAQPRRHGCTRAPRRVREPRAAHRRPAARRGYRASAGGRAARSSPAHHTAARPCPEMGPEAVTQTTLRPSASLGCEPLRLAHINLMKPICECGREWPSRAKPGETGRPSSLSSSPCPVVAGRGADGAGWRATHAAGARRARGARVRAQDGRAPFTREKGGGTRA